MAKNRPLVIGLAIGAVIIAAVAIILLFNGSNSPPASVANLSTSTAAQDENTVRTQVYAEMTGTAVILASTNQAATVVSMQETLNAQSTAIANPQGGANIIITATLAPQSVASTPVPNSVSVSATQATCQLVVSEDGIPQGNFYQMVVEPNTAHLWLSGHACIVYGGLEVQCFPVSRTSGNAIVFLPVNNQRTEYTLTDIIPNLNYHGAYEGCTDTERQSWVNTRAENLFYPPNCADGRGCQEVRFAVIQGPRVVSNEVRQAPQTAAQSVCLTLADLRQLGSIVQELTEQGQLAGAQIAFRQDYTALPGWTLHLEGQTVASVRGGQTASLWSPNVCRPLAR